MMDVMRCLPAGWSRLPDFSDWVEDVLRRFGPLAQQQQQLEQQELR